MVKQIAAFGEVMMRMQVPGHQTLSQAQSLDYSFSGTGVNITAALAKLGHCTSLISTLPKNAVGDAALSFLKGLGIGDSLLQRAGENVGIYFLENGFGVRQSRVTYANRAESSFNTVKMDAYPSRKIAEQMDWLHFCGISLAMNDQVRYNMKKLAKMVKENGGTVIFDCNYRPGLWGENGYLHASGHYEDMLKLADIVMMNEQDARFILGMETDKHDPKAQVIDLIPKVANKYGISLIAGTHRTIHDDNHHTLRGFIYKNQSFRFSKDLTFSVLDRIGAGDAFTSGIMHSEMKGFAAEKAIAFATTAGMLAHTVIGDSPIASEQDIFEAMSGSAGDIKR